ncbi:MAG: F0F1 ATP synthase subunit B [Gammaproteobacteria bacterium]
MSINATLLAQMLVFAVLVWFTMKYVWPMILNAMQEREVRIADGIAAGENGRRELEEAESRSTELLTQGRDKAQDYISQAQRRADEIVEEAKTTAREEGERLIQAARAQIEQERNQARDALRSQVATLAIAGAERILKREVDAKAHSSVLEELATEL